MFRAIISPHTKIIIVSSGLSMYWIRQLWGYEIVHKELCSEYHNVHYCDVADWLYDAQMNSIEWNKQRSLLTKHR